MSTRELWKRLSGKMSNYDKINDEFNSYFRDRDVFLDDFDESSFTIVSYESLDSDDMTDIEEHILGFAKPVLMDISPRLETGNGKVIPYVMLEYKAYIGKEEFSDDELQESKEDRDDRLYHEAKDEGVL